MRVLIAEDDADIATLYRLALEAAGHSVVIADDGQRALDYAIGATYDVLLLDISLPRIGGLEVLERLRRANVPTAVLVLSNFSGYELEARARALGAVGWHVKSRVMP